MFEAITKKKKEEFEALKSTVPANDAYKPYSYGIKIFLIFFVTKIFHEGHVQNYSMKKINLSYCLTETVYSISTTFELQVFKFTRYIHLNR